jgi:arylsulfatase A-like enzyme
MRATLRFFFLLLVSGAATVGCSHGPDGPSILLVTLDTTRADHISGYGYGKPTTPHIDRLAADGTRYTRAYAVTSWTLPAHASLFTGKFPSAHGAMYAADGKLRLSQGIGGPWDNYGANPMSYEETTLAEALKAEGYATGAAVAGPWLKRIFGLGKGFDMYDDANFVGDERIGELAGRPGEDVSRSAIEFIDDNEKGAFFLFLNYYDPHQPLSPPAEYVRRFWSEPMPEQGTPEFTRFQLAVYDAAIQYTDHQLGRVIEHLKELGLYEDMWIIVTADHGELYGENDTWGHGDSLSEPEIKIPLIIKEPGADRPRGIDDTPVQQTDILPLLLTRLGLPLPAGVQGQPIPSVDHPIFAEVYPLPHMNQGASKGPRQLGDFRTLIEGRYKYVWSSRGNHALYDLGNDPLERENVLVLHTDVAEKMLSTMDRYMASFPKPGEVGDVGDVDTETMDALQKFGYTGEDEDR